MSQVMRLAPATTALVLVDLQAGIVDLPLEPTPGREIARRCARLAAAFRAAGAPVIYVRVILAEMRPGPVDHPMHDAAAPPPPPEASELVSEAGCLSTDLLVTKRQWGAFVGTNLDQTLRRLSVATVVIGGIATNLGVESTARAAADLDYAVVLIADAMTSANAEAHDFAIQHMFPLMGRVRQSDEVIAALAS